MNKIEFANESFKNIQELIRFIDQKSGAVLVIAGLVFTAFIEYLKDIQIVNLESTTLLGGITFISGLCTLISIVVVMYLSIFKVLKPRLAKNYKSDEFSLIYFEHIESLGKDGISKNYDSLEESTMLKLLTDQQFEVSQIMSQKTKYLGCSFSWLFCSLISVIIYILSSTQL